MARARVVFLVGFAALAAGLALTACGGDDDSSPAEEAEHAIAFDRLKDLREGMGPKQAFRKLGTTPEQEYEKLRGIDGDVLFVCYRFVIADGGPSDRAELCFRRDRVLTSIGATRTSAGGAPVPGVPASP